VRHYHGHAEGTATSDIARPVLFLHNCSLLFGIYDVVEAIQDLGLTRLILKLGAQKPLERLIDQISFAAQGYRIISIPPNGESIHMAVPCILLMHLQI
jgi:hypothetical protein